MKVIDILAAVYGFAVLFAVVHLAGQWIADRLDRCTERRIRARG